MIERRRLRQRASSGTARSWRPSDLILPGTRSSPLSPTILVARGVSGEEFPAATGGGCVLDSGDAAEDDGGGGVPAAVVGCEAATGDGVPAEAGGGEAISNGGYTSSPRIWRSRGKL